MFDHKLEQLTDIIIKQKTIYEDRNKQLSETNSQLTDLISKQELYKKTSEFLNTFSSDMRLQVSKKVESIVTEVLQKVMNSKLYEFKIVFEQKRGTTEAQYLLFDTEYNEYMDILDNNGGGVADTVSTILFFTFLQIHTPASDFIIFDEVGKGVSPDKRGEFYRLLKMLSIEYKKQLIYISHQNEILDVADNLIKIG